MERELVVIVRRRADSAMGCARCHEGVDVDVQTFGAIVQGAKPLCVVCSTDIAGQHPGAFTPAGPATSPN